MFVPDVRLVAYTPDKNTSEALMALTAYAKRFKDFKDYGKRASSSQRHGGLRGRVTRMREGEGAHGATTAAMMPCKMPKKRQGMKFSAGESTAVSKEQDAGTTRMRRTISGWIFSVRD